jgi:tRNA A-37 threonylcarbamoyl transferase component Bud32
MLEFALQPKSRLPEPPDGELASALAAAFRLDLPSIQEMTIERSILRELPGRRIVVRVGLRRRGVTVASAVAKMDADGRGEPLFRVLAPLDLPIPKLLAYLPEHRLLLMEEVSGQRLDHQVLAGGGDETARRAGTSVAILHRNQPPGLERITIELLLAGLRPQPADLPGLLRGRAAALATALGDLPDPIERLAVLCHRDLHPQQIIDDGKRASLLDLDLAGRGHPALDLANFEVYLRVRHPRRAERIFAAFSQGYAAAGGRGRDPGAERFYRAFTYLRLAMKTFRMANAGWPEQAAILVSHGLGELGLPGPVQPQATP